MKNNKGFTLVELVISVAILVLIPICAYGWIHNIYVLFHSTFTPVTGPLVLRAIGVFLAPLGVVTGYM